MNTDPQSVIADLRRRTVFIQSRNQIESETPCQPVKEDSTIEIDDTIPTRKCPLCRLMLQLDRFERDPSSRTGGGRRDVCRECEGKRDAGLVEQKRERKRKAAAEHFRIQREFNQFREANQAWKRIRLPHLPNDKKSRKASQIRRDKNGKKLATAWNSFGRDPRRRYGISSKDLYELKRKQFNCCRCCGLPRPTLPLFKRTAAYRELIVDMLPEKRTIVGLVCWRCAPVIKKARKRRDMLTDLPDRVMAKCVADYLELPPIEIFS